MTCRSSCDTHWQSLQPLAEREGVCADKWCRNGVRGKEFGILVGAMWKWVLAEEVQGTRSAGSQRAFTRICGEEFTGGKRRHGVRQLRR